MNPRSSLTLVVYYNNVCSTLVPSDGNPYVIYRDINLYYAQVHFMIFENA